ncbi:MAG: heavy metal-associated domain-containing protein [Opitutaceae bacterium]|nr:heavy metal-associated domain-containing protein [Opitutaceae bacterium]
MGNWLTSFVSETWSILLEMAPYLILGFFLAGLLSVIFKQEWVERWLGKQSLGAVVKASIFGVPLPLCSCGVIPVTTSLYQRGASKGATTSFLTSTPQTGVDSILATTALIGPAFAGIRVLVALVSGIITGLLVDLFEPSRTKPETPLICRPQSSEAKKESALIKIIRSGFYTLPQDIGKSLALGIVLAGLLSAVLPENLGEPYLRTPWLTYLAVTLIAIPLYVCSTGSIPIAFALMASGVSPGATLVFLIAGPATNVATVTTLLKILGRRTIAIYLVSIIALSWVGGWFVDAFGSGWFAGVDLHHHTIATLFPIHLISGIALIIMVVWAGASPYLKKSPSPNRLNQDSLFMIKVEGMTCSHCANSVEKALKELSEVSAARADASRNLAWIEGTPINAEAGFEFKGLV